MSNQRQKRYNIRLGEQVANYYEERAKITGQSLSAVLAMALTEYYEQKQGLSTMNDLMDEYKKMDKGVSK